MTAFAYMLRCSDGSYYVGSARGDLDHRIAEHNAGLHEGYTFRRRPVALVWSQEFDRITDAIAAERQIKGWSRAKKEALIAGKYGTIKQLARRRTPFFSPFETEASLPPQGEENGSVASGAREV